MASASRWRYLKMWTLPFRQICGVGGFQKGGWWGEMGFWGTPPTPLGPPPDLGGGRLEGVVIGQDDLEVSETAVAAGNGDHAVAGEVETDEGQLRQLWGGHEGVNGDPLKRGTPP